MIHKYNLVSYPRTGSNFILNTLKSLGYLFNNEYLPDEVDSTKQFFKTHDFEGKIEIHDESKYLVLLRRDYILNIDAYMRMHLEELSEIDAHNCFKYYIDFYNKWINNAKNKDNILIVFVEDFNENTYLKIAKFFDLDDIHINTFVNDCVKDLFFKIKITKDHYRSILDITKSIINDEKLTLEYEITDCPDYNYL